ncbi:hypothetical protein JKG47_05800 [Acidithiobacillus sp. MC6.1]|nr:hypothetical protein [Acidithiobacillus sp. MC6.1]
MNVLRWSIGFVAALGLAGCATGPQVVTHLVNPTHYAPTSVVETLHAAPHRPYQVIAQLKAEAPAGTPPAQVIAMLEKRAEALGANAIILHNESTATPAQLQYNPSGGNYQNVPARVIPVYSGVAIRWTSDRKQSTGTP